MRLPTLARDRSKRPIRGTPIGDMVTGPCEAVACGIILHRGDEFVVYLGDRLMCRQCHVAGAALTPVGGGIPTHGEKASRKKGPLLRKKDELLAIRRARTEQLRGEVAGDA